jgi:hypothetical protein
MLQAIKIDENGFFVEDVILDNNNSLTGDVNLVFTPVPNTGFMKPKWDFDNDIWVEGEEQEVIIDNRKEFLLDKIKQHFAVAINNLTNGYTDAEIKTWEIQRDEAKAYDGTPESVPFLSNLAATRGIDLEILVDKVKDNVDIYCKAVSTILGEQHKNEDLIAACESLQELYDYENDFDNTVGLVP